MLESGRQGSDGAACAVLQFRQDIAGLVERQRVDGLVLRGIRNILENLKASVRHSVPERPTQVLVAARWRVVLQGQVLFLALDRLDGAALIIRFQREKFTLVRGAAALLLGGLALLSRKSEEVQGADLAGQVTNTAESVLFLCRLCESL